MGFLLRRCSRKGPHLAMTEEPRGFSRVVAGFSTYNGELREPLLLARGSPISIRVARGSWGLLSSHCRANRPHLGLCPDATPWTVAYQVPPSMGFSRQEYWSGLPFPSPGDLSNPGTECRSPANPNWKRRSKTLTVCR